MAMVPHFVMPEIALQKIIQIGIKELRNNEEAFRGIFTSLTDDELNHDYGEEYITKMWTWFNEVKLPAIQAWAWNAQRIPSYSIHLTMEGEDEQKAAISDFFDSEEDEYNLSVFTVTLDIGIHAHKQFDQVLWLYYILMYILFKQKRRAEKLGLQLQTLSASDYQPDARYMADNVYTRWIKFRCTVQNTWKQVDSEYHDIVIETDYESVTETE